MKKEAQDESPSALEEIGERRLARRTFLKGALATAPLLFIDPSRLWAQKEQPDELTGPSTTTEPYMIPSIEGVEFVSILTVGDAVGKYRMVGIPDGLGAFENGRGTFTLLMNHELGGTSGAVRAHGSKGAFVSRWTIDRRTLKVLEGEDFTQSPDAVNIWDSALKQHVPGTTVWQRFCSGDLAKEDAFFANGKGTKERIYLNGEETTTRVNNVVVEQGRAWAHIATGKHAGEAWELPCLGRMAFENVVASPSAQEKTIVVLLDDSAISTAPVINDNVPSEVYVYIGTKQKEGHPIEQAGLTNGNLYGVKISVSGNPVTEESNDFGLGTQATGFVGEGTFSLHNLGDVSGLTAVQIQDMSIAGGVARLQRVEDGAWDLRQKHSNDFYFVTTASLTANCRLWRLRFDDIKNPEKGGTIEILLAGDEGHGMLDNVTIDGLGRILMDEDPGNSGRLAKLWMYSIDTGDFIQVGEQNPKFFDATLPNNTSFLTQDEESSGIIDAEHILGEGWFLFDVQVHKENPDPELVEFGQLLALFVDPEIGGGSDNGKDDEKNDKKGNDRDKDKRKARRRQRGDDDKRNAKG